MSAQPDKAEVADIQVEGPLGQGSQRDVPGWGLTQAVRRAPQDTVPEAVTDRDPNVSEMPIWAVASSVTVAARGVPKRSL